MSKTLYKVDTMKSANMLSETSGKKSISFETYMVNADNNIIGVKVTSEDGELCQKISEDAGNAIAVAMDVLLGKTLPVGAKFHLSIDFDTEK